MQGFRSKRPGGLPDRKRDVSAEANPESSQDKSLEFQVETQGVEETWEWDGTSWRRVG
jgi:hypothetical protein